MRVSLTCHLLGQRACFRNGFKNTIRFGLENQSGVSTEHPKISVLTLRKLIIFSSLSVNSPAVLVIVRLGLDGFTAYVGYQVFEFLLSRFTSVPFPTRNKTTFRSSETVMPKLLILS